MDSSTSFFGQVHVKLKVCLVYFIIVIKEIYVLNANSIAADQPPRCAASDLGLHFFPKLAKNKWVNSHPFL